MGKYEKEKKDREEKLEYILSKILSNDERVLWQGKPSEILIKKIKLITISMLLSVISLILLGFALFMILGNSLLILLSILSPTLIILFGDILLASNELENRDYFITTKKIIKVNTEYIDPIIIVVDLKQVDKITFNYRFKREIEIFVLRGNEKTKSIQEVEFHSQYYSNHTNKCIFFISNGVKELSTAYKEGNASIKFMYLDEWKKVFELIQNLFPEKIKE